MAQDKTQFLKFSAYSIRDAIIRKLSQDSKFTDQVYESSNLMVLIDMVSYMYQCLIYQLNSAASESMFSDTQIYENISRLCKFIGYNPRGFTPSQLEVFIDLTRMNSYKFEVLKLLKYSYFETGLTDSQGKPICYSYVSNERAKSFESSAYHAVKLVNGRWRLHSEVFTASGTDYETFVLSGVKSDSDTNQFVANDFIQIYVQSDDESDTSPWINDRDGIFTTYNNSQTDQVAQVNIYNSNAKVYQTYLNEQKTYELKFGDGVTGKKLHKGDHVYVFYLETNGVEGEVDPTDFDLTNAKFKHDSFGLTGALYKRVFGVDMDDESVITHPSHTDYSLILKSNSMTTAVVEESVQQIRENAPNWFKLGNRLITRNDYEYAVKNLSIVKNTIAQNIIDVKCMNNVEYIASLYKWLYMLGLNSKKDPSGSKYLNQDVIRRCDFKYIDPADANNTYLWLKCEDDVNNQTLMSIEADLNDVLNPIKTMTTEIKVVKPVDVAFAICAADEDYVLSNYLGTASLGFDYDSENTIEITLDDNTVYTTYAVQQLVYDSIVNAFNVNTCTLGQQINFADITNSLYAINGVKRVRTIFQKKGSTQYKAIDGLSFATWSRLDTIDYGFEDLKVSNIMTTLEDFQFPTLFQYGSSLMNKIKVIKKSTNSINTVKQ